MPNVITHQDGRCKCYLFTLPKEADDTAKLLKILSAGVLAIVGNLLWRLVCEQVILLFSIHERLVSIDRSLKTR
jgi:hypothetical protein